jgi:asparagine synthetase B (glutamine-hydrolysing)
MGDTVSGAFLQHPPKGPEECNQGVFNFRPGEYTTSTNRQHMFIGTYWTEKCWKVKITSSQRRD